MLVTQTTCSPRASDATDPFVLIVDTGPLVATSDRDNPDHAACRELLETSSPLITTGLVIAEAAFLIARQVGPAGEAALMVDIAEERVVVEASTLEDWVRASELISG